MGEYAGMSGTLFRMEVMEARRGDWLGSIVVAAPLSRWLLTALAMSIASALLLFLFLGSYTRRETVAGQLVPSAGLLNRSRMTASTAATCTTIRRLCWSNAFGADLRDV